MCLRAAPWNGTRYNTPPGLRLLSAESFLAPLAGPHAVEILLNALLPPAVVQFRFDIAAGRCLRIGVVPSSERDCGIQGRISANPTCPSLPRARPVRPDQSRSWLTETKLARSETCEPEGQALSRMVKNDGPVPWSASVPASPRGRRRRPAAVGPSITSLPEPGRHDIAVPYRAGGGGRRCLSSPIQAGRRLPGTTDGRQRRGGARRRGIRASPVWVLAALSDVCGLGRHLIPEDCGMVEAAGTPRRERRDYFELQSAARRPRAVGRVAESFNTPPLDVPALREEWRAIREEARSLRPGSASQR